VPVSEAKIKCNFFTILYVAYSVAVAVAAAVAAVAVAVAQIPCTKVSNQNRLKYDLTA